VLGHPVPISDMGRVMFLDDVFLEQDRHRLSEHLWDAGADKAAEVLWLRQNVMGPDQAVWLLRITARDRYSDRCWA
jgi:hypothetical protein